LLWILSVSFHFFSHVNKAINTFHTSFLCLNVTLHNDTQHMTESETDKGGQECWRRGRCFTVTPKCLFMALR